jgi:hypothetical protein
MLRELCGSSAGATAGFPHECRRSPAQEAKKRRINLNRSEEKPEWFSNRITVKKIIDIHPAQLV